MHSSMVMVIRMAVVVMVTRMAVVVTATVIHHIPMTITSIWWLLPTIMDIPIATMVHITIVTASI